MAGAVFIFSLFFVTWTCVCDAQSIGFKECPAGRLKCLNGGSVVESLCVSYVKTNEAVLMECDCPPEFDGIHCQIPKSTAGCPAGYYFESDPFTLKGPQTFECQIDQSDISSSQPQAPWRFWKTWYKNPTFQEEIGKLIGHSVHVSVDWSRKEIDMKILSRVKRRFSLFFPEDLGPVQEVVKCSGRGCVSNGASATCQTFVCSTVHKQFPAFNQALSNLSGPITAITFGTGTIDIANIFTFDSCKHGTCVPLHPLGHSTLMGQVLTPIVACVLLLSLIGVAFFMHRETLNPPSKIAIVARAKKGFGRVHSKRKSSGFSIPIGLLWRDLSYTLPTKRSLLRCRQFPGEKILQQTSGIVSPGELVAIIGPSGAGKSTLLDLLGGLNKVGTTTGNISLTGPHSRNYPSSHLLSYVVQADHFLAVMTVWETLYFSAVTRLPRVITEDELLDRVVETLQIVGLTHVATSVVGTPETGGISGGERRRLAVGVELIAEPRVLLLDEVTSGLDSYYASEILSALRDVATKSGMAIVLTIHQPPAATFSLFDRIVLMSSGGRTVFQGPPKTAVEFVYENGLTPEPWVNGCNPFEFLVAALGSSKVDAASEAYRSSSEYQAMSKEIDRLLSAGNGSSSAARSEKCDQLFVGARIRQRLSFFQQTSVLTMRSFRTVTRDPGLLLIYNIMTLLVALFAGFIFVNLDLSVSGIQNRSGFVFCAIIVGSLLSMASVDSFVIDRILFEKESRAGCYGVIPYFLSKLAVDLIPFRIFPGLIFSCISYYWIGFQRDFLHFAVFTGVLILSNAVAGASIFAISTASADVKSANLIGVTYFMFNIVFGGPLLSQAQRQSSSAFLSWFSFFYYAFETMVSNEIMGLPFFLKLADLVQDDRFGNEGQDATGEEMLKTMSWNPNNRFFNVCVLCGILAGCYALALVMLKFYQRKTR